MNRKMISIALAAYNGEKYIREQLDSILAQTYDNFELIICDDCSTDSTANILKEYESTDKRIKCYFNSHNIGFKRNFEKAISLCSGEYIALSDQDDIWTLDHLEVLLDNIREYDFIYSQSMFIDEFGKTSGKYLFNDKYIKKTKKLNLLNLFYLILLRNHVQGCTVLFKKELNSLFLPIPEKVKYHDWWFALIAVFFFKTHYINKATVLYRKHGNNTSEDEKYLDKKIKRSNYYHIRHNTIISFINNFGSKMTPKEMCFCQNIIKYYYSVINNKNLLFRLIFYIRSYFIINLDESIKKYFLFLPRTAYQIFPKKVVL